MTTPAPWQPRGTVYGTLLNFQREHALWAPRMAEAPYKAAPKAPVLYVKTANTFAHYGAAVSVPGEVWVSASLGLVVGNSDQNRALAQDGQAQAAIKTGSLPGVIGCVLLADLSLPHESYYRPPIKFRNRDGFLVCVPAVTPLALAELAGLQIETRINGTLVQTQDLSTLVRDAAALLADVSEFMTLQPGDVLMLGTDCLPDGTRPLAKAGDRIDIRAPGLAPLGHTLVQEAA